MLDHYKEIRTQLIGNIEHLTQISSRRNNDKIAENLKEIREKLIENRFHLVVLGQFKHGCHQAGKTSSTILMEKYSALLMSLTGSAAAQGP